MAERANQVGNQVQSATPTTNEKPSTQEKPATPSAQGKSSGGVPTASDFHPTPNQPYVAATDSGYKIFPPGVVSVDPGIVPGLYGQVQALPLVGPDGQTIGWWRDDVGGWIAPDGHSVVKELAGLKPDPAWTPWGGTPTSIRPPDLSDDDEIFRPEGGPASNKEVM